jgi:tetratricopeptide (TPR) repeat protein
LKTTIFRDPILVGRKKELEELQRCLDSAKAGKGETVFISGEAGTGKTRLVNEFIKLHGSEEIITLTGWCLYNAEIPYFPFIQAFTNYFSTNEKREEELQINRRLKDPLRVEKEGLISPQALKDQTFLAVADTLQIISKSRPILFFIDDAHWADSASLALLHYLARVISKQKILIIVTYRSEELNLDDDGHQHPLIDTLKLMGRENLFKQIQLKNLVRDDILSLTEDLIGGPVSSQLVDKLVHESQGNPLFIVESLRMMSEKGSLIFECDQWQLSNNEIDIPDKIKDIITHRVDSLKPNLKRVLDIASIIGFKFEPGLISQLIGRSNVEVLEILDEIAKSSSLVVEEGTTYRFDHIKTRDAVYEKISLPLKQAYHQQIAEKLEIKYKNESSIAVDLAYHFSKTENRAKAIDYSLAAGQYSLSKWSNLQAIEQFKYVLQIADEKQQIVRSKASEGLGDAYVANSMYNEAIETFGLLATIEKGKNKLRAIRKIMDAAFLKGDSPEILLKYSAEAKKLHIDDQLEMARVLNNRGRVFFWSNMGDPRREIADYDTALKIFEKNYATADAAVSLLRSGPVYTLIDKLQTKGLSQILRSIAILRDLGDLREEAKANLSLALGLRICGLYPEAVDEFNKTIEIGEKVAAFSELAQASIWLSEIVEMDDLEKAIGLSLKALEYCKKTDADWIRFLVCANLTRQYSKLGNLKCAKEYFTEINEIPQTKHNVFASTAIGKAKATYQAVKALQWKELTSFYDRIFQNFPIAIGPKIGLFTEYAWVLDKQGASQQAANKRDEIQRLNQQVKKNYEHPNIQLDIMLPSIVLAEKEFEIRLDLTNVARKIGVLIKILGLLPTGVRVISLPSFCKIESTSIVLSKKEIGSFKIQTIKLRMAFSKPGTYVLNPVLYYSDDLGKIKIKKSKPIEIKTEEKMQPFGKAEYTLEFNSTASEKAFHFLTSAFKEDYFTLRLPEEKSGWRTMMDVVRKAHVTVYNMYGRSGSGGKTMLELGHLGIIETRFYNSERGRGGHILKIRINPLEIEKLKQQSNVEAKSNFRNLE